MSKVVAANTDVVTNKSNHSMVIAFPSVCRAPMPSSGPVPIPYPNIARTATEKQQSKVKFERETVVTLGSSFSQVHGNEPGTARGMTSSKMAEAAALRNMLGNLHTMMLTLPPRDPAVWQQALEDYAVAASALYVTLNDDD